MKVRCLGRGPYGEIVTFKLRQSSVGLHRRMGNITVQIRLLNHLQGGSATSLDIAGPTFYIALAGVIHEVIEDSLVVKARLRDVVVGLELRQGVLRQVGILVQYGHQFTISEDLVSIHAVHRRRIEALEPGAVRRRPQDPCVHHAGNSEVTGIHGLACHFLHGVNAIDRIAYQIVLADSLDTGRNLQMPLDSLAFGQFAVCYFARLLVLVKYNAVFDGQLVLGHVEPQGGQFDQNGTGLGPGSPENRSERRCCRRAPRGTVVRAESRIRHHHFDRFQRHVKLVGQRLGQGSHDALPLLDPARITRDPAVFTYMKMCVETAASASAGPSARHVTEGEQYYDSTAQTLKESTAADGIGTLVTAALGDLRFVIVHLYPAPFISWAASSIARMIRVCAPHLHRLYSIPSMISCRLGSGLLNRRL